jgi:hypothetical protein
MRLTNPVDELPYCRWELADGGEAVTNRFYKVIAERDAEGRIVPTRGGRFPIVSESWAYFSACFQKTPLSDKKTRERCRSILIDFYEGRPVADRFEWTTTKMLAAGPKGR